MCALSRVAPRTSSHRRVIIVIIGRILCIERTTKVACIRRWVQRARGGSAGHPTKFQLQ